MTSSMGMYMYVYGCEWVNDWYVQKEAQNVSFNQNQMNKQQQNFRLHLLAIITMFLKF
jgi:hypothetical protein